MPHKFSLPWLVKKETTTPDAPRVPGCDFFGCDWDPGGELTTTLTRSPMLLLNCLSQNRSRKVGIDHRFAITGHDAIGQLHHRSTIAITREKSRFLFRQR